MAQLIIRNLDEDVVLRLKARAAQRGQSLEQSLRDLLSEAARPGREAVLKRADQIRARSRPAGPEAPDTVSMLRRLRDRGGA